jgi:tRNA-2-methylthio-N6-dimethylallyladenosine synthase
MQKKVFLKTYGCQMNVRDSEVIAGLLLKAGHKITDDQSRADVIILNTCSVRQHAEEKVWSEIGRIGKESTLARGKCELGINARGMPNSRSKNREEGPIIGIVGCMAQNYKEKIFQRAPSVDFVVGPSDIDKIPGIINKLLISPKSGTVPFGDSPFLERKIWETDGEIRPEEIYHTGFHEDKDHAYVVISEGCSNFCSYCVVPYVRGQLHNRNYEDILKEIEEAVDKGIASITLLGQNVNAYISNSKFKNQNAKLKFKIQNSEETDFIALLAMVNKIKGLKEFSFITSHPKDTSIELFKAMADSAKLKKHLHLPVQSGSDRILKLMNRGYTRKFYLDLADNYRKIVKGGALTTDIIVGFPGETEADFQETFSLVKETGFNAAYIFKYSPRPNTAAAELEDDVPKEKKERRHKIILGLQKRNSKLKMKN